MASDIFGDCAGEDNEEEMDEGSDAEREVAEGFLEDAKFAVEDRYRSKLIFGQGVTTLLGSFCLAFAFQPGGLFPRSLKAVCRQGLVDSAQGACRHRRGGRREDD